MKRKIFIQTLLLSSGGIFLSGSMCLKNWKPDKNSFRLLMIYNNIGKSSSLINGWGLAVWIEKEKSATLFDTGGDASVLWKNIRETGIDIKNLSKIVISHNHWDHKNGLNLILEKTFNQPEVYIVEKDLTEYKSLLPNVKLTGISHARQIDQEIWTTGQLKGFIGGSEIYEQSVILDTEQSVCILTGCSHPGIVNIVRTTRGIFPDKDIAFVAGGFHLMEKSEKEIREISNELKALKVNTIAPSHCTGSLAISIFREEWGDKMIDFNLGQHLHPEQWDKAI